MTINNTGRGNTPLESELAQRFFQLKDSQSEQVPSFSAQKTHGRNVSTLRAWGMTGSIAAAILITASTVVLWQQPQEEDPATLYLAIMAHNVVTTDTFLETTPGVLPEFGSVPELYNINFAERPGD